MRPKFFSIYPILALLTIAIYWPATSNQFVAFDDQLYVTENTNVINGLTWQGVYWAFTSFDVANWHPVTWLSHQLDVSLFGLNAKAHHATNILLHTVNTLLLLFLLVRLTGALWRSVLVAVIFALHPVHVESVAWVAERKDLLCAFFFLLTIHAYIRYTQCVRWFSFLPVAMLFTLSLMAKPMSVTLPFVLLLLDWWPLQRIGKIPLRSIVLEKLPLILLSGISCAVTILAQRAGGAVITVYKLNILERIGNASSAYLLYLWKMIWPHDLAILYPLPSTLPFRLAAFGAVVIILIVIVAYRQRNIRPYLLVGWFWYLGMLVPVIGLVQVGVQSHADRYTYLPLVGSCIVIVWGMHDISAGWRYGHRVLILLTAGLIAMFAFQTRQQVFIWRDSETLFRHAIAVTSDNYVMHMNLGIALWDQNKRDEAISEYRKAIKIRPNYADQHFILANALFVQGDFEEAAHEYQTTLTLRPAFPFAHTNRGMALQKIGRLEEAVVEYSEGLRLMPNDYKASENLQNLLNK